MVLRCESLDLGTEFKLYLPSLFEDVMSKNVLVVSKMSGRVLYP